VGMGLTGKMCLSSNPLEDFASCSAIELMSNIGCPWFKLAFLSLISKEAESWVAVVKVLVVLCVLEHQTAQNKNKLPSNKSV
jgi:hypothetical protein